MSVGFVIPFAMALASPGAAQAHAVLHHASPEAGSTVSEAPHEVTLMFTDTLEPAFSSADVTDASGGRVDEGKAQVSGSAIRVGVRALAPGSYRVHWRVISVDTHKVEGSFIFNVKSP
jgi:methionine-rich copper-binding protein CopC